MPAANAQTQLAFDQAAAAAQKLAEDLRRAPDPEAAAADAFEKAVAELGQKQVQPEEFLPATGGADQLGFARTTGGRKKLLAIYLDLLREKLCQKDGELNKLVMLGIGGVSSSVMTLVITTLGLSLVALPVAITITGIILATGVDAFCKWTAPDHAG